MKRLNFGVLSSRNNKKKTTSRIHRSIKSSEFGFCCLVNVGPAPRGHSRSGERAGAPHLRVLDTHNPHPPIRHLPEPIRRSVTGHLKAITTDKKSINPAGLPSPANTHGDRAQSASPAGRHIVIQGESININQIFGDTRRMY